MSFRKTGIAPACLLFLGCVTAAPDMSAPVQRPPAVGSPVVGSDRLRSIDGQRDGLHSVLLVPSPVAGLVAVGAGARCRVFVGAVVSSRFVGRDREVGLALIVQSIGGGLAAALVVAPTMRITVDGEAVIDGPIGQSAMYGIEPGPWGPVETVMLPVRRAPLERIATGSQVTVRIGLMMQFGLSRDHLTGLGELLGQIPEDARFGAPGGAALRPGWRTQ